MKKGEKKDVWRDARKGREEGRKEGKEEGRAEGVKQNSFDIAKRMLEKGIDIETISELTGLTAEEVSGLKEEMRNA